MNLPSRRQLATSFLILAGTLTVGFWPWPGLRAAFAGAYCGAADLVLQHAEFGRGGHVRLRPAAPTDVRRAGEQVTSDATAAITVDGFAGELALGLNLRRDVYLPLVVLVAVIGAASLGPRRKLRCLAAGLPGALALSFASLWLLFVWTFGRQLRGVYHLSGWSTTLLDLGYSALLAPPSNRFVFPLILALGLIYRVRLR